MDALKYRSTSASANEARHFVAIKESDEDSYITVVRLNEHKASL